MTEQSNSAAERSAHVHCAITHNGETYIKLADASVTFSLYRKDIAAQAARITELEAALRFYADAENWRLNGQLDPNSSNFTGGPARAALGEKQ